MSAPSQRRQDGWILFDAPVAGRPRATDACDWPLLERNARLTGGVKFARVPAATGLRLRAELPLETEGDLEARVAAVLAGYTAAKRRSRGIDPPAPPTCDVEPDLAALCREAGWAFAERSAGALAVDLEVPGGIHAARVACRAGEIALTVELFSAAELSPLQRAAVARLLLRAGGAFRMVRGAAGPEPGSARLETTVPADATAQELGEALGALAVATRGCAREAALLAADEAVGQAYLARRDA